jgi:antitoxin ParD1/3/4
MYRDSSMAPKPRDPQGSVGERRTDGEARSQELVESVLELSEQYGSASDVERTGLRLLESRDMQVRALQEALKAGEVSGALRPFDREAFLARMRAAHDG